MSTFDRATQDAIDKTAEALCGFRDRQRTNGEVANEAIRLAKAAKLQVGTHNESHRDPIITAIVKRSKEMLDAKKG